MITFDEENHKYHNEHGVEYISVTTYLSTFKKPFDTEYHAKRIAEKQGTTPEQIKNLWKSITEQSHVKGKAHHKAMENYIRYGEVDEEYADLIASVDRASAGFKAKKKTAEGLLWHDASQIAGTADLMLENDTEFYVMDFKTNKKFNYISSFNERLLPPLDFLDYSEFTLYSLQLSLYAYMKQAQTKKHCKGLKILYLSVNNFSNKKYWKEIPVFYCKDTIETLIKHRKTQIQQ